MTRACAAQWDTLERTAPDLHRQPWYPCKLTDIRGDHGEAVGKTGSRQPQIMGANHLPRCGEGGTELCMGTSGHQIHRKEGKTLQDRFDKC